MADAEAAAGCSEAQASQNQTGGAPNNLISQTGQMMPCRAMREQAGACQAQHSASASAMQQVQAVEHAGARWQAALPALRRPAAPLMGAQRPKRARPCAWAHTPHVLFLGPSKALWTHSKHPTLPRPQLILIAA